MVVGIVHSKVEPFTLLCNVAVMIRYWSCGTWVLNVVVATTFAVGIQIGTQETQGLNAKGIGCQFVTCCIVVTCNMHCYYKLATIVK
jgi:hypothetical protein